MKSFWHILLLIPVHATQGSPAPLASRPFEVIVEQPVDSSACEVLTIRKSQILRGISSGDVFSTNLSTASGGRRYSFISDDEGALSIAVQSICDNNVLRDIPWEWDSGIDMQRAFPMRPPTRSPPLRIEPLIQSGSSSNRVDLVFFGDGYQKTEYAKFIEDARRLAEDISYNQTFNTVRPLLNFWASFSPSRESGIGVGGVPKDTVYGLYRDGTELRGVYYSKPEVARAACFSMGDQCDYPILMGNDPYYGGLGGEFTVITPSLMNGPLVLRHELGHSVIDVGEEYDGGFAYFGVNAAQNASSPVSWSHWLSDPLSQEEERNHRPERSVMPLQAYPWTLLNTSAPWAVNFTASGMYHRHLVRFSLSGLPEASDLTVEIDGVDLDWKPRAEIGMDRWHYDIHRPGGLSDGQHAVTFKLNNAEREGVAQMCSVEVLEFGDETQFNSTPGHYGLYPTFSLDNTTTYRPTNENCLMRVVTTPDFCKVCTEGLWHSLLRRVDLIDDLDITCSAAENQRHTANLSLVPLAQLRTEAVMSEESYTVTWYKDGEVLSTYANSTVLEIGDEDSVGSFSVEVHFTTEEVRLDKDGLLSSYRNFTVGDICSSDTGSYRN